MGGKRTQLSEHIDVRREELRLSENGDMHLKAYAGRLDVPHWKLAKYSAGLGVQPGKLHEDVLRALAEDFAKSTNPAIQSVGSLEQVRDAATTPFDGGSSEAGRAQKKVIRFGFGHSIWAAPVAYAFKRKPLFRGTSGGYRFEATSFYRAADLDQADGDATTSPAFSDEQDEPLFTPAPDQATQFLGASAAQVMDWLSAGEIQVACVPSQVVKNRAQTVAKVGTVVDSASGCSLVYSPKKRLGTLLPGSDQCITTRGLGHVWSKLNDGDKGKKAATGPWAIGFEEKTAAWDYLEHSFRLEFDDDSKLQLKQHAEPASDVLAGSHQAWVSRLLDRNDPLLGVITWEPVIAKVLTDSNQELKDLPMYFSFDPTEGQNHLTMDVYIAAGRFSDSGFRAALEDAMYEFWHAAASIVAAAREPTASPELRWAARYYGFARPDQDCNAPEVIEWTRRALSTVRFAVSMDLGFIHDR